VSLILAAFMPSLTTAQVDLCGSSATTNGGCFRICPAGDWIGLVDIGAEISVTVINNGFPVPGISRCDFWLIDCDPLNDLTLCGGSLSSNADFNTDAAGQTTISGPTAGGGCADGLSVVVQGIIIPDPTNCLVPLCLPIVVRSADIDGDLLVNLVDLSIFAGSFPPQPYDLCCDFNCDGVVNLVDLGFFANHFMNPQMHVCVVPVCP
jgi:hypothetical protein